MSAGLPRRLYRSRHDKMLGGVSAGLASYFDIDPVLVRLLWVLGAVFTGGMLALAYIVLWIVVPEEGYAGPPSEVVRDNVNEMATEARRMADEVREAFRRDPSSAEPAPPGEETGMAPQTPIEVVPPVEAQETRRHRSMMAGVILLVLGVLFLAGNVGLSRWFNWEIYWPVLLVALGALLLWNRSRSRS